MIEVAKKIKPNQEETKIINLDTNQNINKVKISAKFVEEEKRKIIL